VLVVGVAEVMRSAAWRATSIMKSWISWRLRSDILIDNLEGIRDGILGLDLNVMERCRGVEDGNYPTAGY
jgi:hypothetical protein